MTDVFEECSSRVSAKEAADRYGLEIRRDWALCPFHQDKKPSLHFYEGRYKCFSCNAGGDSVDFTAGYFGIPALDAVRRLNDDFSLGLALDRPATAADLEEVRKRKEARELKARFDEWRRQFINRLNACIRRANRLTAGGFDSMTEEDRLALLYREPMEAWAEQLSEDSMERRMEIFRMRGEIEELICKILKNSRTN